MLQYIYKRDHCYSSFISFSFALCGTLQFLTLTSFLSFLHNALLTLHNASSCFITTTSRCYFPSSPGSLPHPVILSFPCLFLSNSSSCPPPSPLPATLCITAATISTRLPTDSKAGLCLRGQETNSRDLCHSLKFLENIWSVIKQLLSSPLFWSPSKWKIDSARLRV